MSGPAALREDRDAIDNGAGDFDVSKDQRARHDFGVAYDPATEPGYESVGRVVLRVIDGGMKLGA
jgi:hypothetical protein